ncbi:MAG: hypothetical protein QM742_09090 [Aquabacterium sp.]
MNSRFTSGALKDLVDQDHELVQLASRIQWGSIEKALIMASDRAVRPTTDGSDWRCARLFLGMVCLKALLNISWDVLFTRWPEEVHWQFFCGMKWYRPLPPCGVKELSLFEDAIQNSGMAPMIRLAMSATATAIQAPTQQSCLPAVKAAAQ